MKNKESKSLQILKKGFKRNEVVIYAIALMLVTAGYFNYTANVESNTTEIASSDVIENNISEESKNNTETNNTESTSVEVAEENNSTNDENIGDARLVSNNEVNNENDVQQDTKEQEDSKEKEPEVNDYFANSKLQRDTNYADMISTYTKILQDSSVSETQKSIAMKEITKINNDKNAISISENLLSTKGFKDYVILVNNDSINVIVKVEGGLSKEKVAQIQNIISREFKCEISNIHITEN